jgi:GNAT superfamily N-acetyltransferase
MMPNIEIDPTGFDDWAALYRMLCDAYAYMDGRIDPPSFLKSMTAEDLARKAAVEEFYLIRDGGLPIACMFGTDAQGNYEVGKLGIAPARQGAGLGRAMIEAAADRARARGYAILQLYARIELTENHAIYEHLGFERVATFTHAGFDRPTSLIFQRAL